MTESPFISPATASDFTVKVIKASREVPVMVDFWADWCGPCRSLTPLLHDLVTELNGAVRLVTVDTDREVELARQYKIRSLPTVMLFKDGDKVDEFMGVLPLSRLRAFVAPHVVRESDRQADHAALLAEQGDLGSAKTTFELAMTSDPENLNVRLRYARSMLDAGDMERATELLDTVPLAFASDPGVPRLRALIEFHRLVDPDRHEAKVAEGSDEPAVLRERAARKVLQGDYAGAMDLQLRLMQNHRGYADNVAQKDLRAVFALADDPDLVKHYQRQMASLLH